MVNSIAKKSNRLRELEQIIYQGKSAFLAVGTALSEILKSKLYLESHSTFEDYLAQRWNLSRSYAYRLISASEINSDLSPIGDTDGQENCVSPIGDSGDTQSSVSPIGVTLTTESQYREIGKVPKEKRSEVIRRATAVAGGKTLTVKGIREAAREEMSGDNASIVADKLGRNVPRNLRAAYSRAGQIDALGRQLDQIKRKAIELAESPGGEFIPVQEIEITCKSLKSVIQQSRYWTSCPRCGSKGCQRCKETGYFPISMRNRLSTSDKQTLGIE